MPIPPSGLDVGDGGRPIIVAVDPVHRARERAIMAHIAHLEPQVALDVGHDIPEILDSRLLGWLEPTMNVAENGYAHRRSQLARRSERSTGDFFPKIASSSTVHSRR